MVRRFTLEDLNEVVTLWNENVEIYKPFTAETFQNHVLKHPDFKIDGAFVLEEDNKIIGFAIGLVREYEKKDPEKPGYLPLLLIKKEYRRCGYAKKLLDAVEDYVKSVGKNKIRVSYRSTLNFPWYIPNTDKHDHAGAPGAFVNSDLYLFLINNEYKVVDHQDAFHLDLERYEMPKKVVEKIKMNENDGYKIEVYNKDYHYGFEEFYDDINDEAFMRVIKANLSLEKPLPFLVISKDGKVLGWTGAMYTEPSGRAHFDGIAISTTIRGRGLGQGLWCSLGKYSKEHGSKFMTFFTGRTNHARHIYLKSGFKIIQSFAIMEKEI